MTLAAILDDCLQRIAAGESIAGCLARYSNHAADLAPMLAVAAQLSGLADQAPAAAQRQRTLARLRQATAEQRAGQRSRPRGGWLAPAFAARRLALAGAVVLLLLATLSAGVVASSQPGQPAYELRVIAERAPAWLAPTATGRATAELATADRRLVDLQTYLERAGQVQPAALRAMLASDRAAARQAMRSGAEAREQVAGRLAVRARLLAELADAATDPTAAQALAAAARNTLLLVQQLQAGPGRQPSLDPPVGGASSTPTATPSVTATATPTSTDTATVTPSGTATVSATPAPVSTDAEQAATQRPDGAPPSPATPSATPSGLATPRPRPRLTALAQTATALAQTPLPNQTPRPRLTALAQTATALAQTPRPRQTALAQTSTAAAQTATAQAATPSPTPTATPGQTNPEPTSAATPEPTVPVEPTATPWPPRPPGPQPRPTRPGVRP